MQLLYAFAVFFVKIVSFAFLPIFSKEFAYMAIITSEIAARVRWYNIMPCPYAHAHI